MGFFFLHTGEQKFRAQNSLRKCLTSGYSCMDYLAQLLSAACLPPQAGPNASFPSDEPERNVNLQRTASFQLRSSFVPASFQLRFERMAFSPGTNYAGPQL